MMQQKIEAAERMPTLRTAIDQLDVIAGDLGDVSALVFALTYPNPDFEFNHQTLRAVVLAIDSIKAQAVADREALERALPFVT